MGLKSIYTVLDVFDLGPLDLQTSALSKCFSSPTEVGKYIVELVYIPGINRPGTLTMSVLS